MNAAKERSRSLQSQLSIPGVSDSRVAQLATVNPKLSPEDLQYLIAESDNVKERLHDEGVEHIGAEMHARLRAIHPSDADCQVYFMAHREVFGNRSFDESRTVVDRLVRLEMLRQELGILPISP